MAGAGFKPVEARAACLVGSTPTSFRQGPVGLGHLEMELFMQRSKQSRGRVPWHG